MGLSLQQKFEARVTSVPFSTCLYWTGEANAQGYGLLDRRRATHVSYELAHGAVPATIEGRRAVVRHKCDTPLCVNPDHLEIGTQADNMRDMAERNRSRSGERHHGVKLTDAAMADIAVAFEAGERGIDIARRFGVSASRISMIRHGFAKRHQAAKPTGRSDRRVSDETARAIYSAAWGGVPRAELAHLYGVSVQMVSDIKRGATYASVTGAGG